ncbi:N-acetylmuramoyl-L-alanine amidase [Agrobacterium sp. NPDC089420]|uniref:N-acetylmuramoyl-L-alanine amidase n=1 Tax=Agrobacterium sp. NPDC089420 TaxID=3363918 RepID=UPI00384D5298
MVYSVKENRLQLNGSDVDFVDTPNMSGQVKPLYLVLHYTAGMTADGAISWFKNRTAQASAHFVVDRDGSVTQMVPLDRIAWHAGRSSWQGVESLNAYSIGIEIVNAGKLSRTEKGDWMNWADNVVPVGEVTVLTHKHETHPSGWHLYTKAQLESVSEIGLALNERFKFLDVLGHEDISPGRKIDPGPAFPMISVSSKMMGRR